jgi:hypothetical protein
VTRRCRLGGKFCHSINCGLVITRHEMSSRQGVCSFSANRDAAMILRCPSVNTARAVWRHEHVLCEQVADDVGSVPSRIDRAWAACPCGVAAAPFAAAAAA